MVTYFLPAASGAWADAGQRRWAGRHREACSDPADLPRAAPARHTLPAVHVGAYTHMCTRARTHTAPTPVPVLLQLRGSSLVPQSRFPRQPPGRCIPGAEQGLGRAAGERPVPPARCHRPQEPTHTLGPGCSNAGAGHSLGTCIKAWPELFLPVGLRRLFQRQTIAHKQVSKLTISKLGWWVVFPLHNVPVCHQRRCLVLLGCKMVLGVPPGAGTRSMAPPQLGPQHPRLSWCFPGSAGPACAPSPALNPRCLPQCQTGAWGSGTARADPGAAGQPAPAGLHQQGLGTGGGLPK